MLPRVAGSVRVALVRAQAGHLRADEGPVRHVVMLQGRDSRRVAGELHVPVEERSGEPGGAEPFQVHGQEGGIVEAVDVPQPIVELQAVQHAWPVGQAEDVVGEQVAVAVADEPVRDAGANSASRPAR